VINTSKKVDGIHTLVNVITFFTLQKVKKALTSSCYSNQLVMPYVFTVGNDTGGATKTTCVIELGVALALKGKKVCLIGLDENSELSEYLGIDVDQLDTSSSMIFLEENPKDLARRLPKEKTGVEQLWIIPSAPDLIEVIRRKSREHQEKLLRNYIDNHLNEFDIVLIDTPAGLNMLKLNGVYAADFIIIPTRYDGKTTRAITRFTSHIEAVKGTEFNNYGILISAVDLRKKRNIEKTKTLLEEYSDKNLVFTTKIPTDADIEAAQSEHKTSHVFNIHSKAGKAYSQLAEEILCYF